MIPAFITETVAFPSDVLKEAICRGLRCGIREGRAGLDKVRWLESRYATALWSRLHGHTEQADSIEFIEVELMEIYASSGIAQALGLVTGETISAADLLKTLTQEMMKAAKSTLA